MPPEPASHRQAVARTAEVIALGARHADRASAWAARLGLPYRIEDGNGPTAGAGARLEVDDAGLALRVGDGPIVRLDVLALLRSERKGKDLLGRAVGRESRTVVDATAGLGRDGVHLAAIGKEVTLVERVPLVAALVEDALARASGAGGDASAVVARLRLVNADARAYLNALVTSGGERPDAVLLDPMYPERGKTALPGKGMALFRDLVGDDEDAPELLAVALRVAVRRVVVKRPVAAPRLAGPAPVGAVRGRTTRFDIYAPRAP
ncbi:MAG: class I SAM-dependent methyltransferase [Trueperaceae bacterium]